ncbi:4-hydroxybenzoate transporter [Klebsiella quasipneumoniae]|nr:4-hydroxybenzoate transporter [Klebsiella quasipneumoniae]
MTKITTANSSRLVVTIGLCFMVALMEGLDLQAAGIAAVGMAQAFALDKMQMGWIFSAGILGLLPGALVGGMLADRHGRKRILLGSVLLFGLFSLATAVAWSFPTLLLARLLTGVGLGAALPNLIALTSEAAGPRFRGRAVSLMYCGVPIGAALAAALGFSGLAAAWQTIFWIGGVVPLLLIPLLMRWLPESQAFQRVETSVPLRTLFAPGHAAAHPVCPGACRCHAAAVAGLFLHSAGGLYADQLAADAAGRPGIQRQPGGGGDVLSADRRRLRHPAAGGADG